MAASAPDEKKTFTIKTLRAHVRVHSWFSNTFNYIDHFWLLITLSSVLLVNRTCCRWNAQKEDRYCLCSEDQSGHLPE